MPERRVHWSDVDTSGLTPEQAGYAVRLAYLLALKSSRRKWCFGNTIYSVISDGDDIPTKSKKS